MIFGVRDFFFFDDFVRWMVINVCELFELRLICLSVIFFLCGFDVL